MMAEATNSLLMQTRTFRFSRFVLLLTCSIFLIGMSGCGVSPTPTPFIAPYGPRMTPTLPPVNVPAWTATPEVDLNGENASSTPASAPSKTARPAAPTSLASKTPALEAPETKEPRETVETFTATPRACIDSLRYLADLTYPDGSYVTPGQAIEKQWQVENNGTCDWDANYRIKLVEGYPAMGVAAELPFVTGRTGSQVTVTINFTAPAEAGTYQTAWQVYNPEGFPFGETIFMVIVVSP
jgi:hypothetical protein